MSASTDITTTLECDKCGDTFNLLTINATTEDESQELTREEAYQKFNWWYDAENGLDYCESCKDEYMIS